MSKKTKSRIALLALSIILFVACLSVSLNVSGYVLPVGWKQSTQKVTLPDAYAGNYAICDRALIEKGFPLTFVRPYDDASDCTDQFNGIAIVFDAIVALVVSLGIGLLIIKASTRISNK